MNFQLTFQVNERLYLRNPENSELGKQIVKNAIDLVYELGFEHFTFKKLALHMNTTEATVYRYFENKHRLLLYMLNWYWHYISFLVDFKLQNLTDEKTKLEAIIDLLTHDMPESAGGQDYNKNLLHQIVIAESSKAYLVKEVTEINKDEAFKPYKELCGKIAEVISAYNPAYEFPRSLSTTLIETSHYLQFFSRYLPKLTDVATTSGKEFTTRYLQDLLFKTLNGHKA